jgi:hypothetical protein
MARAPSTAQTSIPALNAVGERFQPVGEPESGSRPQQTSLVIPWSDFGARGLPETRAEHQNHVAGRCGLRSAALRPDWYSIWLQTSRSPWWRRGVERPSSHRAKSSPTRLDTPLRKKVSAESRTSQKFVTRGILVTVSFRLGRLSAPGLHDRLSRPVWIFSSIARSKVPTSSYSGLKNT